MRRPFTLFLSLAFLQACGGNNLPPSEGDAAASLAAVAITTHTITIIAETMGEIADSAAQGSTVRIQRDPFSGTVTRSTDCINGEGGSTAVTSYTGDKASATVFTHHFEMALTFQDCLADDQTRMALTASQSPLTITGSDERSAEGETLSYEAHGVVNYTSDEGNGSCGVAYTSTQQEIPGSDSSVVSFSGKVCGIRFSDLRQIRAGVVPQYRR